MHPSMMPRSTAEHVDSGIASNQTPGVMSQVSQAKQVAFLVFCGQNCLPKFVSIILAQKAEQLPRIFTLT